MMQHILIVKVRFQIIFNYSIISDKIFKNKAYEIARNRKYDEYQRALGSIVCKVFAKKQDQE